MKLAFKALKGHEVGIWEAQVLALACAPRTHVTWSRPFGTRALQAFLSSRVPWMGPRGHRSPGMLLFG